MSPTLIYSLDFGLDPISWIAISILAIVAAGIVAWYLHAVVWALRKKPVTGEESLIGKEGLAVGDFIPSEGGEVNMDGVIWKAKSNDPSEKILRGDPIIVLRVSSVTLFVGKKPPKGKLAG